MFHFVSFLLANLSQVYIIFSVIFQENEVYWERVWIRGICRVFLLKLKELKC